MKSPTTEKAVFCMVPHDPNDHGLKPGDPYIGDEGGVRFDPRGVKS